MAGTYGLALFVWRMEYGIRPLDVLYLHPDAPDPLLELGLNNAVQRWVALHRDGRPRVWWGRPRRDPQATGNDVLLTAALAGPLARWIGEATARRLAPRDPWWSWPRLRRLPPSRSSRPPTACASPSESSLVDFELRLAFSTSPPISPWTHRGGRWRATPWPRWCPSLAGYRLRRPARTDGNATWRTPPRCCATQFVF
ncbi:MAG: hypothetical protein U1F87_05865 [Kiritimatiellia bacterium]